MYDQMPWIRRGRRSSQRSTASAIVVTAQECLLFSFIEPAGFKTRLERSFSLIPQGAELTAIWREEMPVERRKQAQQPLNGHCTDERPTSGSKPLSPHHLLSYADSLQQVPWQTDNDHILSGYRPHLPTLRACLNSAFGYVHNETVNIHTHFLGAVIAALLIPLHLIPTHFPFTSDPLPTPPTVHDKIALTLNLLCAVSCLSLSSWFHTVQCCDKATCDAAHRGDYMGIVILTTGSIVPGMYYAFYGQPVLQVLYMGAIITAGIAAAYASIVLSPHHRAHRWHRTLVFIALGLSAVFPIMHIILLKGIAYARETVSLDLILASGGSYIFGAVLYASRVPERLSPGTFDYFGSSHQIFHCFVLLGAALQYCALRGMVWGRSAAVGMTS